VSTRRERLQTLMALASYHLPFAQKPEVPPIFVTSARSLMTRTMPRRDFLKACRKLTSGQSVQPDVLARSLVEIGYQRVNTVLEPGQFSRRGGLMDVWAPAEKLPVRLDFFGDEIETVRRFDPASQRTVESLESVRSHRRVSTLPWGQTDNRLKRDYRSSISLSCTHSLPACWTTSHKKR
jgi:transcription-repair coupling factor (superfamily II helicase)